MAWGKAAIEARLASLCAQAEDAVRSGYTIIIISDRNIDREHVAIPALLALSAIHLHLVGKGLRTSTGLVVETGSAREVHHFALLGGYGAEAVHPYLAFETLLAAKGLSADELDGKKAVKSFTKAIGKGLKKVMSKMGISTYMSYTGAQIFEAVGLARSLVDKYFTGTTSNIEGVGVFEIAEEAIRVHQAAFGDDPVLAGALDAGGEYAFRVRGEEHVWTTDVVAKLQHSTRQNSYATYKEYAALINDQSERLMTFRGLFEFRFDRCTPVPIEEVEPAAEIVKRFSTGAMSLGSISTEAHTTLAIAMNRIGGKSNTGEGGEDRRRYGLVKAGESLDVTARQRSGGDRPSAQRGRPPQVEDQASRLRPLWRYHRVLGVRRAAADQDRAGGEARRGRPTAGSQSVRVHRGDPLLNSRRGADLAAAAPRHLFDRGSSAAHSRPQECESAALRSASSSCPKSGLERSRPA